MSEDFLSRQMAAADVQDAKSLMDDVATQAAMDSDDLIEDLAAEACDILSELCDRLAGIEQERLHRPNKSWKHALYTSAAASTEAEMTLDELLAREAAGEPADLRKARGPVR